MKKVKETMKAKGASDDAVKEFETGAGAYAKKIIANFKDYEFLIGESMDPDGMYVGPSCCSPHVLVTDYLQGCSPQLPRGWCHPLRYSVEAWLQRGEGVSSRQEM